MYCMAVYCYLFLPIHPHEAHLVPNRKWRRWKHLVLGQHTNWAIHIPSGNQTWLAGKSPMNAGFIRKITYIYSKRSTFQHAMFDDTGGQNPCWWENLRGWTKWLILDHDNARVIVDQSVWWTNYDLGIWYTRWFDESYFNIWIVKIVRSCGLNSLISECCSTMTIINK